MSTPTTPRRPGPANGRPTEGGPQYLTDKHNHIADHFDAALRVANGTHQNPTRPAPQQSSGRPTRPTQATPGSDFMSNEDIHAFAEALRKDARNRAVERSLDAAQLEAVLRNIPDAHGSMTGARTRARRVTRHLKVIAAAEKVIAKSSAALYAAFEREYDAELRKIGKGRPRPPQRTPFTWR